MTTLKRHYDLYDLYEDYANNIDEKMMNEELPRYKGKARQAVICKTMAKDLESLENIYQLHITDYIRNAEQVFSLISLSGWECIYNSPTVRITLIRDTKAKDWRKYITGLKNYVNKSLT
jgi:spore coat polysaccharide biosynthesis protein SpsF (cytidylyltransferase family)